MVESTVQIRHDDFTVFMTAVATSVVESAIRMHRNVLAVFRTMVTTSVVELVIHNDFAVL